jgi:glycosyltransferase involved in cell wall biosynthesis
MIKNTEEEIRASWPKNSDICVSIGCITYNHEKYIEKSILSFLSQKTIFPFEILIHDDASTDRTAEIIQKYEQLFPNIIRPIYQIENKFSIDPQLPFSLNIKRAQGKYIALCEGDDYWTDSLKLQKQVDAMELHPECDISFHAALDASTDKPIASFGEKRFFSLNDIILAGGGFCPTASLMLRCELVKEIPEFFYKAPVGDYFIQILGAAKGGALYLPELMSVYRTDATGSWTNSIQNTQRNIEFKRSFIKSLRELDLYLDSVCHTSILKVISDCEYALAFLYIKNADLFSFKELLENLTSPIKPLNKKHLLLRRFNKKYLRVLFFKIFNLLLFLKWKNIP